MFIVGRTEKAEKRVVVIVSWIEECKGVGRVFKSEVNGRVSNQSMLGFFVLVSSVSR